MITDQWWTVTVWQATNWDHLPDCMACHSSVKFWQSY